MKRFCLSFLLVLAVPVVLEAQSQEDVCIKIDKVGEAPGMWSGLLAATQWLDATVVFSPSEDFKVGDKISFGLNVVQGDKLADGQTPRLSPKIFYAGAILTVGARANCRADVSNGCIYTSVRKGCAKGTTVPK
jgi:hypothetical protein